jgi:glycosyltransferase involved in cell wall biosynthesis
MIYGGTITASLNYARLLANAGNKVYVSTTNTNKTSRLAVPTKDVIEIEKNIFVRYYNETIVDKLSLPLLLNVWKDIKTADIVHVQAIFNTPIPVALFFARVFKKPVVLSPHGVLGEWIMNHGLLFKKLWLNLLIRPFAYYVHWHATSNQERNEILTHFPKAKIITIANSIDLSEFSKSNILSGSEFIEKFTGIKTTPGKIVVSMGRLQRKKGFDILIHSFVRILEEHPNAYLLIAGDDDGERNSLLSMIHTMSLTDKVFLIGNLQGQDKVDFLANANLFVLPSHNENFGMVYAEALATGTPIIASKFTPWEEVEQFNCGKWIDNTQEETSKAMFEMLKKNNTDIKKNAKNLVKKFSSENIQKELQEVLELIARKDA